MGNPHQISRWANKVTDIFIVKSDKSTVGFIIIIITTANDSRSSYAVADRYFLIQRCSIIYAVNRLVDTPKSGPTSSYIESI